MVGSCSSLAVQLQQMPLGWLVQVNPFKPAAVLKPHLQQLWLIATSFCFHLFSARNRDNETQTSRGKGAHGWHGWDELGFLRPRFMLEPRSFTEKSVECMPETQHKHTTDSTSTSRSKSDLQPLNNPHGLMRNITFRSAQLHLPRMRHPRGTSNNRFSAATDHALVFSVHSENPAGSCCTKSNACTYI